MFVTYHGDRIPPQLSKTLQFKTTDMRWMEFIRRVERDLLQRQIDAMDIIIHLSLTEWEEFMNEVREMSLHYSSKSPFDIRQRKCLFYGIPVHLDAVEFI